MLKTFETEHACPFCGQMVMIRTDEEMTEYERDRRAKARCGCSQACRERDLAEAMDKLEQVCGVTSTDNGFDMAVGDAAMEVCRKMVERVYDNEIREVTVRSLFGDKILIRADGSDVKIKRTCQKQMML